MKIIARYLLFICLAALSLDPVFAEILEEGFRDPPAAARARCWWHWMDRNITKWGITKDLESMKAAGLGGATILDVSCFGDDLKGPVKTLSPEWFDCVNHAVCEAKRIGLDLSVANCPGWSSSGGPWIRPEYAMKNLGFTETTVEGGKRLSLQLKQCELPKKFGKDVAVVAFPAIPGDGYEFKDDVVKTTIHHDPDLVLPPEAEHVKYLFDGTALWDGKWNTQVPFNPKLSKRLQGVDFELKAPRQMCGVKVGVSGPPWRNYTRYRVSVSADGTDWKRHFESGWMVRESDVIPFPPVESRFFRLEPIEGDWTPVISVRFTPAARIPQLCMKAYYQHNTFNSFPTFAKDVADCPADAAIDPDRIVDLTAQTDEEGRLEWDAPAGRWTIMRFTMFTRQSGNHPANPEGRGLECDKMSAAGVDEVWRGMMKPIVDRAKASGAEGIVRYTLIDSYEVGPQNWTDRMPEEFRALRGYSLVKYLPVFSGRYVKDSPTSERFLEDFRRTVSDLYAKYYGEYFRRKVNADGVQFELEPYGGPFDELLQGRAADVAMGEFWHGPPWGVGNAKLASNVADVNGKRYVQTETFTAGYKAAAWTSCPSDHKLQGDYAFAKGVNRFVFHSYAHQAYETTGPGITMGVWGFHFNRHNTLWPFYRGWLDYVGRAQYLLQQGQTVADVLYVTKEDTPVSPTFKPETPYGWNGNAIDARTFAEGVEAAGGEAVIPGGRRYPVVVLPQDEVVSPALLDKARELLASGVAVVRGPKPVRSFGLAEREARDRAVAAFAKTWETLPKTVEEALSSRGVAADFTVVGNADFTKLQQGQEALQWIHRRTDDLDIYFIANVQRGMEPLRFTASFRTQGEPELWDAESGSIRPAPVWRVRNGRMELAMDLPHGTSAFVVFRRGKSPSRTDFGTWPGEEPPPPPRIEIVKAEFRAKDRSKGRDVTDLVRRTLTGGDRFVLKANSADMGGDAAPNKHKELYCEYRVDGEPQTAVADEYRTVTVVAPPRKTDVRLPGEIASVDCSKAWSVTFQANRGAPEGSVAFENLVPLNERTEPGIRYFSGTATYRKTVELSAAYGDRTKYALTLDLGNVHDLAELVVNGRSLGILWHYPFRVDATQALKPGANVIEVRVANRWINRLIGDEQEGEVGSWTTAGQGIRLLREFPEGYVEGRLPKGHYAFTTCRPYGKDDPLKPAGLVGPVRIAIRGVSD